MDCPIIGINQIPQNGEAELGSIRDMAASYAHRLQAVYPAGPYKLLGWSVGGVVAHEFAIELRRRRCVVQRLILLDVIPSKISSDAARDPALEGQILEYTLRFSFGIDIHEQSESLIYQEVEELIVQRALAGVTVSKQLLEFIVQNVKANALYVAEHLPGVFDGDVITFSAAKK